MFLGQLDVPPNYTHERSGVPFGPVFLYLLKERLSETDRNAINGEEREDQRWPR